VSIKNLEGATLSSRFRLERQLGRGGYGSVFEAEQLSVGRRCAVKVLAPKAGRDSTTEKRFSQEARTTSQLTHPNSIVLYDFGHDDRRDLLWLAMELLDGETLQSRIRREGTMSVDRCLHVVRQAAESLQEAHEFGLVHRDIKPGNIMLLQRGGDPDFVKIIDFGIAKMVRDTLAPGDDMTQTGRILGTPKYMAPEQIRDTKVDGRADMYALATVVYAMLTARVPFSEGTAMEIASRQITERPPKIRDIAPNLDVGYAFESVLLQALSKDPNRRFADILAFADALEDAALTGPSVMPEATEKTGAIEAAERQAGAAVASPVEDAVSDVHAETDDEIVATTEQIAGGETPTAEVGRMDVPHVDAHDESIQPSPRGEVDVTLDTVAVASPRDSVGRSDTVEEDTAQPISARPESGGKLVRLLAVASIIAFLGSVGAWWVIGSDEDAATDPQEVETVVNEVTAELPESARDEGASQKVGVEAEGETVEPSEPDHLEATSEPKETSGKPGRVRDAGAELATDSDASDKENAADAPKRRRRVTVRAIPWGELYIDGRRAGSGSQIDVTVAEGRREFMLKQNGRVRARRTVDVSAGSPKIIELVAD
jgi:serine/threonine-protein kinase